MKKFIRNMLRPPSANFITPASVSVNIKVYITLCITLESFHFLTAIKSEMQGTGSNGDCFYPYRQNVVFMSFSACLFN